MDSSENIHFGLGNFSFTLHFFQKREDQIKYLTRERNKLMSQNAWRVGTFFIVFSRLVAPLFIFRQPLLVFLIFSFSDWVDFLFLKASGASQKTYQRIDKSLDLYCQFFMVLYGLGTGFSLVFLALFLYRLLGTIGFLLTTKEIFLFVFPNFVEVFFLTHILSIFLGLNYLLLLGLLVFLKMVQEYFVHIKISFKVLEIKVGERLYQFEV